MKIFTISASIGDIPAQIDDPKPYLIITPVHRVRKIENNQQGSPFSKVSTHWPLNINKLQTLVLNC